MDKQLNAIRSTVKGPPVVDLHEDISWYYPLGDRLDFPLGTPSKTSRIRHGDIPK